MERKGNEKIYCIWTVWMRKCNYKNNAMKNSSDLFSCIVVQVKCELNEEIFVACKWLFLFLKNHHQWAIKLTFFFLLVQYVPFIQVWTS